MKILFVVPYPLGLAPSQRFRFEQYLPELVESGIFYKVQPFWSKSAWTILYKERHQLQKILSLAVGYARRLLLLPRLPFYDFIFIHREATPVGPPWFEWLAAKVFRKKIIFDFDDAIWLENTSPDNNFAARFKWHRKIESLCNWSYKISCGNSYLQAFAKKYKQAAILLPTTIDTAQYTNRQKQHQDTRKLIIGWTGSHSTLPYLKPIELVLQKLAQKYTFDFVVIADKPPQLNLQSLVYWPWRKETEVEDLLQFDIGLMPLPDTAWAKGKCAFKALQYMALGIPAVVSAVGENLKAVPDGVAGYTCSTDGEWYSALEELLLRKEKRAELGQAGRHWVQQHYAKQVHLQTFLSLFS